MLKAWLKESPLLGSLTDSTHGCQNTDHWLHLVGWIGFSQQFSVHWAGTTWNSSLVWQYGGGSCYLKPSTHRLNVGQHRSFFLLNIFCQTSMLENQQPTSSRSAHSANRWIVRKQKKKKKTPKLIVCTRLKRPHSWMHRKETWIAAMQLWDKLTVCCRNSFTVYFTQFPIRIVEFWILIVHYHIYNDNDWDLTIKVHYHCGSNCTNPIAVQV